MSKLTPAIEAVGYGLSGDIGGLPKTTYYLPDGRIVRMTPNLREYNLRDKAGNIISTGKRDANLDKGWLLSRPAILKPHCVACGEWHDTQEQVERCALEQPKFVERMAGQTKKEAMDNTSALEQKVAELTTLVEKLMEGRG